MPPGGQNPSLGNYVFLVTECCVPVVTDFSVVLFTDNKFFLKELICSFFLLILLSSGQGSKTYVETFFLSHGQ